MGKLLKKSTSVALAMAIAITSFTYANTLVSASEVSVQAQRNVMDIIYVSTNGNDTSGDGTQANPFGTLQRAQQAVQQINQNMTGNIIVSIAPGDYYMPSTLNLTSQDSGTNGYNIVYESSGGVGAAKLYGGKPVDSNGWTQAAESDVTNYGMLTSMVGKVWKVQLNKADYPTTFSGLSSSAFNTLYVNDTRATSARTPNLLPQEGFPEAKDTYNRVSGSSNGSNIQINKSDLTADQINGLQLAQQNGEEVAQVFTWDGGTGGVNGTWDWFTETEPVASATVGSSTITLNQPQANGSDFYNKYQYRVKYTVSNGSRYFLQHNLSFLDTPDEYHYDKTTGVLYYYPADGTMTNKTVVTPTMQTVINLQGTPKASPGDQPNPTQQVHNIVFDGLAVKDTEFSDYYSYTYNYGDANGGIGQFPPAALMPGVTEPAYVESAERPAFQVGSITLQGTNHITIKNSDIKNAGIYGIFMLGDNQYNTIENTTVENTGNGGISIDGGYPGVGKYSNHHTINNVLIHDVGQLVGHGVGLTVMSCGQSTFSHLEIYNSPKRGMLILGGYPRGGQSANPNFDNVRDNYTVGNHFSYLYVHHTHEDAGEDSAVFLSWLTAGGEQWYSSGTQHGSNDVNHLTTNLSQIDPSIDRYNYMDQVLISNIGTAASVHEKNSVGGLDTAMGATGFVFSNVQAINTQSHSLAIRPGSYGDMYIFQNVTENVSDIKSVQSFDPSKMKYNLIGLTSAFPTQLLGTNQHTYQQTSPSNVYFSDTFNAPTLDRTKWTVEKGSVDMSMGVLASPNDPRLGIRSLPIYTPLNPSGVVVSRPFEQPLNKVVTVKFFDRHKDYFTGDSPTTSPNDPILAHTYLRVDDGKTVLGIGANGNVSKDFYTIQKGNQSIVTNARRDFGWRTLTVDYSSGTDVKISIDNQQVATYTTSDGVATAFTYVGMGDWGTSWPDGKAVGSSTDFGDLYIYGGQDAQPLQPIVIVPPTAASTQMYSENFSGYPMGSTSRPTGWVDSRDPSGTLAKYQIVQDATVGQVERITSPDNVVYYGLGNSSLSNYTFTAKMKFVSWSGNSNGTYATFGPSVYVSNNSGANISRYELRYNNPNLTNGQWVIYQRGGSPTDNNLVTNIQMPAGFNMNNWNTYKIVASKGNITFYINDTQVATVSNPSNAFGGFGLGGYDATFDVANISLVQNPTNPPQANIPSGTYNSPQTVTLTPAITSDSVYYTTDGSDPAINGTPYTGNPISINATCTLKVVEVNSGGVYSQTVGYNYTINGTTAIQNAAGVNKQPLNDAITSAKSVAQGNNSTASWNAFQAAIRNATTVLGYNSATSTDIVSAVVVLQNARTHLEPAVAQNSNASLPTVDKAAGTYANPVTVNVQPGTAGEKVYYTLDGSDPSTNGMLYTGPLPINNSGTLRVVEVSSSGNFSLVSSYAYTITNPTASTPVVFSNPRSQIVTDPQLVTFGTSAWASDGGTLTYQWQVSTDNGTTWSNISGATSSTYTTASPVTVANDGTKYQCLITNTNDSLIPVIYTTPAATLNVVAMQTSVNSLTISAKSVTTSNSVSNGTNGPTGTASVTFTATQAGTYYYKVVYSATAQPTISTSGTGVTSVVGDNTISIPNLAPYVPYTVYIQEKDSQGNLSNILKVDIGSGTPDLSFATSGNGTVTQGSSGNYLSGTAMSIVATPAAGSYFLNWNASNAGVFADANSESTEFVTSFYDNTVTANFYNVSDFQASSTGTVNGGTNTDLTIDVEGTNLNKPGAAVGMYVLVNGKRYVITAGTQTVNVIAPPSGDNMTVQLYDQNGNLLGTSNIPIHQLDSVLVGITAPSMITGVANGTAKTAAALGLPATVKLVTDPAGSLNANVAWDVNASSYDPSSHAAQTFTVNGTVTLPDGVANPSNVALTTSISVTVLPVLVSPQATLSSQQQVIAGEALDVTMGLRNVTQSEFHLINAQDLTLTYDAGKTQLGTVTSLVYGLQVIEQQETIPGHVQIILASTNPDGFVAQGDVLKFRFTAKAVTQATTATFGVSNFTIANGLGNEMQINGASSNTQIVLPAVQVDKTALNALMTSAQTKLNAAVEGNKDGLYVTGSKDILQSAIDAASLAANDPNATQVQVNNAKDVLVAAVQAFEDSKIIADVNGNGTVSIGDLAIVSASYGKQPGQIGWNAKADVNKDGKVDVLDLAIVAKAILH